jgi:aryl-alcohol dehydrogenase-like predicted oxidoreductase
MEKRDIGTLKVSVVGLGTNNFGSRLDTAASASVLDACLEAGINFIDTAEVYGNGESERQIGAAIKGRREHFVLATKFRPPGTSQRIREAVEGSLQRLGTDRIDLYQMHAPDTATPIDETLAVLDELVGEGKVREIGSSNFSGWQIADADWTSRTKSLARFVSAQNRYSVLDRDAEHEVIPACVHFGQAMIPYSPLANGLLTGKYRRGEPPPAGARLSEERLRPYLSDERFDVVEALGAFASERGVSILDVAIGGLAAMPAVASVIAGATSSDQVYANARAGSWRPSENDLAALKEVLDSARKKPVTAR